MSTWERKMWELPSRPNQTSTTLFKQESQFPQDLEQGQGCVFPPSNCPYPKWFSFCQDKRKHQHIWKPPEVHRWDLRWGKSERENFKFPLPYRFCYHLSTSGFFDSKRADGSSRHLHQHLTVAFTHWILSLVLRAHVTQCLTQLWIWTPSCK